MKKAFLTVVMSVALCSSLVACGQDSKKAVKEAYEEMGLEEDEVNELLDELDEEDLEELNEYVN